MQTWRATALRCLTSVAVAGAGLAIPITSASAASLPDLSITRTAPATAYVASPYAERIVVTNHGSAAAAEIAVDYAPGTPVVTGGNATVSCGAIMKGHSGRGGGYRRVGWRCFKTVVGGLQPGQSIGVPIRVTSKTVGLLTETLSVASWPNLGQLDAVSHGVVGAVNLVLPAVPAAPSGVGAVQVGDQFHVSWVPDAATASALTSSTVTATPVGSSAPVLTASAAGTTANLLIGPLQPQTTYDITVTNTDVAGTGPASDAVEVITPTSTVKPSAPTGLLARTNNGTLLVTTWNAAVPGDSPVDQYQVTVTFVDGDSPSGPYTQAVDGSTLLAVFGVDIYSSWSVKVRAHNAAGWGPWSPAVAFTGL